MASTLTGAADTEPEAERRRVALFAGMSPRRKVELVEDPNRTSRELALAGLAARYPGATERQRERLLLGLIVGEPLASEIYGPPASFDG